MHHIKIFSAIVAAIFCFVSIACSTYRNVGTSVQVSPLSPEIATEYDLDPAFFKKSAMVQDILIATSDKVADVTILEAAYLFDQMMISLEPGIAQRIREKKVLCVLVGHKEMTSDIPFFTTDKTGEELDFYNWRKRGFLTKVKDRSVVLFAEEDVMEYDGGMQIESILIHEFGHVIQFAGFLPEMTDRMKGIYARSMEKGLYKDGYAAQRFRRVTSDTPVSLLDALEKSFPDQSKVFLTRCLNGGDILVNGKPTTADVKVTRNDKVLIVFGGEKNTYARLNPAEYWAEGVQAWFNTNRTMDHDHNHIHLREQLIAYDPELADLCKTVFGNTSWRFVSPRERAGTGHLVNYDPKTAPKVQKLPHIDKAAQDYYDTYWKDYWQRLHDKYDQKSSSVK